MGFNAGRNADKVTPFTISYCLDKVLTDIEDEA
jgi:hypothetical protein